MKLSTLIATRRKRFRRSASPFFKLGIENLEGRLVMASILPVSVADPAGSSPVTANGPSEQGSISGDGRYVVYLSNAANLVAGQTDTIVAGNNYKDVFLYDSVSKTTKLVSGIHQSCSGRSAWASGKRLQPTESVLVQRTNRHDDAGQPCERLDNNSGQRDGPGRLACDQRRWSTHRVH
jgi:hypothetical protein